MPKGDLTLLLFGWLAGFISSRRVSPHRTRVRCMAAHSPWAYSWRPCRSACLLQSGLYAVQGFGILVGGAVAQVIGAPPAVGLAGLVGPPPPGSR